ncbi:THO complex subunit 5 homolog [Mya arenaria]|uniref:THO complex subunit 5 homolog n=1 Tax=Mya arenaria TaxID=6604 RepID=UPI0022E2C39D|nr:THO complex subunit 5 homolog [Mya arenaria]
MEISKEASEKKRKRTIKIESGTSGGAGDAKAEPKKLKIIHESPAVGGGRALFYAEEEEVEQRKVGQEVTLFHSACDDITRTIKEIKALKESSDKDMKVEIEGKKLEVMLQVVMLKKLNRLSHIRCKKVKDKTTEVKNMIDKSQLQLQNLLYEILHLEKEIVKCLAFRSKDEEIDLVPEEQFYKEAPPEISKPEETEANQHKLTLARLDWELEQRKQLAARLQEAEQKREQMDANNRTTHEQLDNLQPKLNSILQSTKPVQDYLNMPFDAVREEHMIAQYLPHPLFVLYMQTCAYRDAADKGLDVKLEGDVDKAKSVASAGPVTIDEESDSEQEEQEEVEKKNKKRSRRKTADVQKADKKSKVFVRHPLSVVVQVTCEDESSLELTFNFLTYLKVITVMVKVITPSRLNTNCISGSDLLASEEVLCDLYPGDSGFISPNHSNQFDLNRFGLKEFRDYVGQFGHPYLWAQKMGGLQFLSGEPGAPQSTVARHSLPSTVSRLRRRLQSRLELLTQLAALERGTVPVSSKYQSLFPVKLSSSLKSWARSTYPDFLECPYTQRAIEARTAGEGDLYFRAVIERGSANLTAQIVVGPDYPIEAPLFCVNISWGSNRTALNDIHVQELEEEVNVQYEELVHAGSRDQLLTNQLQRLVMCLDVYLETESLTASQEGPVEIAKEKVFTRTARGRQRTKPYKYSSDTGIFTHR